MVVLSHHSVWMDSLSPQPALKCVLCCCTCVPDRHLLTLWTCSALSSVAPLSAHTPHFAVYIPLDDVRPGQSGNSLSHSSLISVWVTHIVQQKVDQIKSKKQQGIRSVYFWHMCKIRSSRNYLRALKKEGDRRIRCLFQALSPILGPLQQIKIISQTDS